MVTTHQHTTKISANQILQQQISDLTGYGKRILERLSFSAVKMKNCLQIVERFHVSSFKMD